MLNLPSTRVYKDIFDYRETYQPGEIRTNSKRRYSVSKGEGHDRRSVVVPAKGRARVRPPLIQSGTRRCHKFGRCQRCKPLCRAVDDDGMASWRRTRHVLQASLTLQFIG